MAAYLSNWSGVFNNSLMTSDTTNLLSDLYSASSWLQNTANINLSSVTRFSDHISANFYNGGSFAMYGVGLNSSTPIISKIIIKTPSNSSFEFLGNITFDTRDSSTGGHIDHIILHDSKHETININVDMSINQYGASIKNLTYKLASGTLTAIGLLSYDLSSNTITGGFASIAFVDKNNHNFLLSDITISYQQISNYNDLDTLINVVMSDNDSINGTFNAEILKGFNGNDILKGNAGNDTLEGGSGNDELFDYSGNNLLNGGEGNDSIYSGTGNDILNGDNGIDTVYYDSYYKGGVTINLGLTTSQNTINAGFDTFISIENINGSNYSDTITGNTSDNMLTGNAGNDKLTGNAGNDWLISGEGDDALNGGDGNDVLNGGNGTDWAHYWNAPSALTLNLNVITPQNTLGAGIDTLIGIEKINASEFNDSITGNFNNNSLLGNGGNDTLTGGDGNDLLTGGKGNDTFIFNTALNTHNIDNITDFSPVDDNLQLAKAIFTKLTTLGSIQSTNFKMSTRAEDNNDFLIYNKANGLLSYDPDGNGYQALIKIAYLGTHPEITFQDFFIA
jgi:Ca2+-binding RTX toxin-like protein